MEKKSHYSCVDGRNYDVTMTWDENFQDTDKIFKIVFIANPNNPTGTFIGQWYYGGSRELLMQDYLTSAYRRACDYIERGH